MALATSVRNFSNVTRPDALPVNACVDALTVALTEDVAEFLCINLDGSLPTAIGEGVIGVGFKSGVTGDDVGVAYSNIRVVQVEPGQAVAINDWLTTAVGGAVQTAATTNHVVGKCLDASDGGGTAEVPHYVRILLTGGPGFVLP